MLMTMRSSVLVVGLDVRALALGFDLLDQHLGSAHSTLLEWVVIRRRDASLGGADLAEVVDLAARPHRPLGD